MLKRLFHFRKYVVNAGTHRSHHNLAQLHSEKLWRERRCERETYLTTVLIILD